MEDTSAQLPNMSGQTVPQETVPVAVQAAPVEQVVQQPAPEVVPAGGDMATQEVVPQVDETPSPSRNGGGAGVMLGVVIAIVIFLCLGGLALIAASYGKGNMFSQAAAYIPVEKIPLINALTKSDTELLRDVVPTSASYALNNKYGGSEWAGSVKVVGDGQTAENQTLNLDLTFAGKTAVGADNKQMQAEYTASGSISSGVVKIDLGQDGAKYTVLMTDPNTFYFMLHLSDQLRQTVDPMIAQLNSALSPAAAGSAPGATTAVPVVNSTDLFDTYWKLDMNEYLKFMTEEMGTTTSPTYDATKYQNATKQLFAAVGPDLQTLYASTLGNFSRYAKVTDMGRQTVNGKPARVIGLEMNNDSVPPVAVEFADGIGKIIVAHPDAFQTFCETIASDDTAKQECAKQFTADNLKTMQMTDTDKTDLQTSLSEAMKQVVFSNVHFYISPVDNTLLKSELTVAPSDVAIATLNAEAAGSKLNKLEITVSNEELSRGKALSVQAPADSKNVIDMIRNIMTTEKQMLGSLGGGLAPAPVVGGVPAGLGAQPAPSGLTPAQQQQYQQMLQYYQQSGTAPTGSTGGSYFPAQ